MIGESQRKPTRSKNKQRSTKKINHYIDSNITEQQETTLDIGTNFLKHSIPNSPDNIMSDSSEYTTPDSPENITPDSPKHVTSDSSKHVTPDSPEHITQDFPERTTSNSSDEQQNYPDTRINCLFLFLALYLIFFELII